jgi:hypothetical protein
MKQRLQERMYNLIAQRAQTADNAERARLSEMIRDIQNRLAQM